MVKAPADLEKAQTFGDAAELFGESEEVIAELTGEATEVIEEPVDDGRRPLSVTLVAVAAFMSSSAAAWMASGIFRGTAPRLAAFIGPAVGTAMVALSYRTRRPSLIQYLTLPVSVVVGALLLIPDATGGSANLPGLVAEAIRLGGVSQPPIAFTPGWRFILVFVTSMLAAGTVSTTLSMRSAKLATFLPGPLIFAAALVQPPKANFLSSAVVLALIVGSLGVAYGAELGREGVSSGQFELRRLGRGVGLFVILAMVLFALSRAGFLFPEPKDNTIIPPKRPDIQPPQVDRVLFTAKAEVRQPFRMGVLDVYDGLGWLLPPYDGSAQYDVPVSGQIPSVITAPEAELTDVTFTIADIEGQVIPSIASTTVVKRDGFAIQVDPRSQMFRLRDQRAAKAMTYTVTGLKPPGAEALAQSAPPPPDLVKEFTLPLNVAPPEVVDLVGRAPTTDAFNRLQFVRTEFYKQVVAAGSGNPIDVPPAKVVDMLDGGEATPFEITAGEVLLARWAGIPARIGYGFYGGEATKASPDVVEVRPKHGATWLEAYFTGFGWVPIVGTPPKAKSSFDQQKKQQDPLIKPSDELAVTLYVPFRIDSIQLLFVVVRYWVLVTLPILTLLALLLAFYPGALKMVRRSKRRRWAAHLSPRERVAVSYTEFRDLCNDLNIGDTIVTPIEFLRVMDADEQHLELAWLVTRILWADLLRDPRPQDADYAEEFAVGLSKRVRSAQPGITRLLALASRSSLREPWTAEVPNLWWATSLRSRVRSAVSRRPPGRFRRVAIVGSLITLLFSGCTSTLDLPSLRGVTRSAMPSPILPETLGEYRFQREPEVEKLYGRVGPKSLVADGQVFTVRREASVLGYLQVSAYRSGLQKREVLRGTLRSLDAEFKSLVVGNQRFFAARSPEQKFFLSFDPRGNYFELLVTKLDVEEADVLFAKILAFQSGQDTSTVQGAVDARIPDPRKGGEE